jgi:uncharacterized protein
MSQFLRNIILRRSQLGKVSHEPVVWTYPSVISGALRHARLADNVEKRVVLTEIPPEHKAFIESREMFFLSTIDHQGRPTVSYKGGDPGFVRVLDSKTVAFPCYDGNGMFYSMGNLLGNPQVGMLFINFEKPHRLRLQGAASIDDDDPLLQEYAEAQLVVRVNVSEIFRNCPRYHLFPTHRRHRRRNGQTIQRLDCCHV